MTRTAFTIATLPSDNRWYAHLTYDWLPTFAMYRWKVSCWGGSSCPPQGKLTAPRARLETGLESPESRELASLEQVMETYVASSLDLEHPKCRYSGRWRVVALSAKLPGNLALLSATFRALEPMVVNSWNVAGLEWHFSFPLFNPPSHAVIKVSNAGIVRIQYHNGRGRLEMRSKEMHFRLDA